MIPDIGPGPGGPGPTGRRPRRRGLPTRMAALARRGNAIDTGRGTVTVTAVPYVCQRGAALP